MTETSATKILNEQMHAVSMTVTAIINALEPDVAKHAHATLEESISTWSAHELSQCRPTEAPARDKLLAIFMRALNDLAGDHELLALRLSKGESNFNLRHLASAWRRPCVRDRWSTPT